MEPCLAPEPEPLAESDLLLGGENIAEITGAR